MKIKRFIATSMRDAIRQVREEQGPDAVILSNRRVSGGIEVVAAVDYDEALMRQTLNRHEQSPASVQQPSPMAVQSVIPPPPPAIAPRTPDAVQALLSHFGDEPVADAPPVSQRPAAAPAVVAAPATAASPVSSQEFLKLQGELGSMRRMIEQQLTGLAWTELKHNRPMRDGVLKVLTDLGVTPGLAREICDAVPESSSADRARFLPLGLLAGRIPIARSELVLEGGIFALIGPTGVGKTTTIAKLAARYAERHGVRDIALVAMDQYRIGAQEQLYTYGRLLGIPVFSVSAQQNLADTLAKLGDRKLVLVDTAGMSQRDAALDAQLQLLTAAHSRLKTVLVLAANSQASDQDDVARRFAAAKPEACVLTKLDEATRIGGGISAAIKHRLPIAYVTDGQRVPEDLQVAAADKLVLQAMRLARQIPVAVDDEVLAVQFAPRPIPAQEESIHA